MVLSGSLVQLSVVNADAPTGNHSSRDQLVVFISDHSGSAFLEYYMNWTYRIVVRDGVNDTHPSN